LVRGSAVLPLHASQRLVDGDHAGEDAGFALGDGVFGLELGALGVEEGEEVGDAFAARTLPSRRRPTR